MSDQWYCRYCGILHEDEVALIRFLVGLEEDEYFECRECGEVIDQNLPPFIKTLVERIAKLEAVAEAAYRVTQLSIVKRYALHNDLRKALQTAGYNGERE